MVNRLRVILRESRCKHSIRWLVRLCTHDQQEPERAVEADWEMQPTRGQSVQIVVEAYDRRGLLKDLTQVIFSDQINIRQVNTISEADGIANMKLLIEVKGLAQLSKYWPVLNSSRELSVPAVWFKATDSFRHD